MWHRMFNPKWLTPIFTLTLLASSLLPTAHVAQAATAISGPVVVRPGGAQLYDEPEGEVLATLSTSTIFTATGRTEDEAWVMGYASVSAVGWLQVSQVIAVGVELLPVANEATTPLVPPAAFTAEGTPTDTSIPTTVSNASEGVESDVIMGTVASGDDRLNVRSGPGTAYAIVTKVLSGASYPVIARSTDGTWLQITLSDEETGWVSATYLQIEGEITRLPIAEAATPPPVATPTPSPETAALTGAAVSGLSGTLIIQSSPGGMFYGYSLDSGALWTLSNGFDPAISPDGQTVTFVRDGGENGIYLIDVDGSNERLIFSGRARLSSPKWSPDGQWILFTRGDGNYQCYELGSSCISPPSGPNGEEIKIPGAEPVTRYWYNLARVDRDGSNYRDIGSLTSARAADWNEAGIVYQSDAGLQTTADAAEFENKLVIFDYLKPFFNDPDWQPQGGRIVYMGKEASHWELFSVNPDGSGKQALTRPQTTIVDEIPSNVAPAWSPDGQMIAFVSNREENGEAGAWRVWVMNADGTNQRPLPIDLEITYTFGAEQQVSWAQ